MKVLFNRISTKFSGAEVYNIYLLKSLKVYKDLDIVFSSDNKELNKKIDELGIPTLFIEPIVREIGTKKGFLNALIKSPQYILQYLSILNKIKNIDLIVFESMTEKLFLTKLLWLQRKKVIWIEHGPLFSTPRAAIIKLFYKINSYFVDKIICVSESTQQDLLQNKVGVKKLTRLYIGIDITEFKPLDEKQIYRIKSRIKWLDNTIIGFVGTLNKEKGIEDFIEVATFLLKKRRKLRFLVVGDGELLNWAKKEVVERGLSQYFHFTGFVASVREYIGIMDVLLFPSYHKEGLSMSLLEATSLGIPVVATDRGGNKEIIINHKNGLLYTNSSTTKVIGLLEQILLKRKAYADLARKVAIDTFSMEECGERFYQLFKGVYNER